MKNQIVIVLTTKDESLNYRIINPQFIKSVKRYASDSDGFSPYKYVAIIHMLERVNSHVKFDRDCGLLKIEYNDKPEGVEAFCLPFHFLEEKF